MGRSFNMGIRTHGKKRALITSLIQTISPLGFMGSATMLLVFSHNFVMVGWRIGFLIGGVSAFMGDFLRYLASESLSFEKIK
jgi:hypothetical protein